MMLSKRKSQIVGVTAAVSLVFGFVPVGVANAVELGGTGSGSVGVESTVGGSNVLSFGGEILSGLVGSVVGLGSSLGFVAPFAAPEPTPTEPPYTGPCKSKADEPCRVGGPRRNVVGTSWGQWWGSENTASGFMRYPNAPTFHTISSDDGTVYYSSRSSTGGPSPDGSQGACLQTPPSLWGPYPWPPKGPSFCIPQSSVTLQNCALAINNGRSPGDPLANYSYGSSWNREAYNNYKREWGYFDEPWSDGSWRFAGNFDTGFVFQYTIQYQVKWGSCQFYGSPYTTTETCTVKTNKHTIEGPFGKGLPSVNNDTGRIIPETVPYSQNQIMLNSWTTELGKSYLKNGSKLAGMGVNNTSLSLVDNCNKERATYSPNPKIDFVGNYKLTKNDQMDVTCEIIVYPGFNKRSFRGCKNPVTANKVDYAIKWCNSPTSFRKSPDPQALTFPNKTFNPNDCGSQTTPPNQIPPIVPQGQPPLTPTIPAPMGWAGPGGGVPSGAWRVQCTPDITRGTGIELWTVNDNGPKTRIPTSFAGQQVQPSIVEADGRVSEVRVPEFTMTITGARGTRLNNKWATWEVLRENSPWAVDGGNNPNAQKQPFSGRVGGQRIFALHKPNVHPRELQPNVNGWGKDQRELDLNFYKGGTTGSGMFLTRASFHENWIMEFDLDSLSGANRTGFFPGPRRVEEFNVVNSCVTPWQAFKSVQVRNSGGSLSR
jgi:hypothetical protein